MDSRNNIFRVILNRFKLRFLICKDKKYVENCKFVNLYFSNVSIR